MATAQSISNLATSSLQNAQTRIHGLSNVMLNDLGSLRASLTVDFNDASASIAQIITDMRATLVSDLPLNEKVGRVGTEVRERVSPVLENIASRVKEVVQALVKRGEDALENAEDAPKTRPNNNNSNANDAQDGNGSNGYAS